MTSGDLVIKALKLVGVIASGETPAAADMQDGLASLNMMIDSLSNEGLLLYKYSRTPLALTAGQASYTLGSLGTLNTPRFMNLPEARVISGSNNVEMPVRVMNIQRYADIEDKTTQSSVVTDLFIDGDFPLYNLIVWPVPSQSLTLVLYSNGPIGRFATSTETVALPPGYEEMLSYNLAKRLAPEYGRPLMAEIVDTANNSLASIKRQNTRAIYMKSDALGLTGGNSAFNINTGK